MKIPSYRRHSSGQGRVTLAGKDYLLGPHGSAGSKRKYNKLVAEFIAGGQSQSFGVKPQELTLIELLAAYNKHLKSYYGVGPESEYHRFRPVRRGLMSLYGPEPAINYGPLQYKTTRAHLMLPTVVKRKDGTKWVRTRSRQYINSLMKKVKRMFRWASAEGKLPFGIGIETQSQQVNQNRHRRRRQQHQSKKPLTLLLRGNSQLGEQPRPQEVRHEQPPRMRRGYRFFRMDCARRVLRSLRSCIRRRLPRYEAQGCVYGTCCN